MKLTGHESSVLAFLAQRPATIDQFKSGLSPDALLVAQYLAGVESKVPPQVKETGDAIKAWAKEREERERLVAVLF